MPDNHKLQFLNTRKIFTPLRRLPFQLKIEAMTLDANMTLQKEEKIRITVRDERKRLLDFIKRRVPTDEDAEDILQDVFYQFVNAYRSVEPIEKVTSWLFTVARNRITDFFRKKKSVSFSSLAPASNDDDDGDQNYFLEEIMQDSNDSPESVYMRSLVWDTLNAALEELPKEQREVFTLHEMDGVSFNEMEKTLGVSLNTLLSRKRYAVLHLRERLQSLYNELLNN